MNGKYSLKLVELMSCAITLGAPLVTGGIISADNVNEVQNISYHKQNTKITFDPNDALIKQALNKVHQGSATKNVTLITQKDGKTNNIDMSNVNGIYVASLQGNQEDTKYQFAVTYQDGKTVKINNPYVDNKSDTPFSVIGNKSTNPLIKPVNFAAVSPNGTMLEMTGSTGNTNQQSVTVNFHLYYIDSSSNKKVSDVALPIQVSQNLYRHIINQNTNKANIVPIMTNVIPLSTIIAHSPNGYEINQQVLQSEKAIIPENSQQGTVSVGPNNTIELDYNVKAVPTSSSSSSNSKSKDQSLEKTSNSSSKQSDLSSSDLASASVSVVSSSKVNASSKNVNSTSGKNQSTIIEKSVNVSTSSKNLASNNKKSSSDTLTLKVSANSENNDNNEQHNTAAVTQESDKNNKASDNFFSNSGSKNTITKQQPAVIKKDDTNNGTNNGTNNNANKGSNNSSTNSSSSLSSSSSSGISSSSMNSSSSSVAGNDNAKSMPQTGEMILHGLEIAGLTILACVGGYYGFNAFKKDKSTKKGK